MKPCKSHILCFGLLALLLADLRYAVANPRAQVEPAQRIINEGSLNSRPWDAVQGSPFDCNFYLRHGQSLLDPNFLRLASGTMSGGGGGEGLACWKTESEAREALDNQGRVTDTARASMVELFKYDLVGAWGDDPLRPRADEPLVAFLDRLIRTNIEPASPYFALRLRQAIAQILGPDGEITGWRDAGGLPKVDDSGIRENWAFVRVEHQLGVYCRPVQLAIRFQFRDAHGAQRVQVSYDRQLFQALGTLNQASSDPRRSIELGQGTFNQATLVLHEAVYLLANAIGQNNANHVKEVLRSILRKPRSNLQSPQEQNENLMLQLRLFGFERHGYAFLPPGPVPAFSQESRQRSHASLEEKRAFYASSIAGEGGERVITHIDDFRSLVRSLTPEEAFLYLVSFQQGRDEFLMPGNSTSSASARKACQNFRSSSPGSLVGSSALNSESSVQSLVRAALNYCSAWHASN